MDVRAVLTEGYAGQRKVIQSAIDKGFSETMPSVLGTFLADTILTKAIIFLEQHPEEQ